MGSRADVLDKVKELLTAARDLSATAPPPSTGVPTAQADPFQQVSGTPALDALKLNGQVISDADLATLLAQIEKAKTDDGTWKNVAGAVGGLLKSLAPLLLAALAILCAFLPVGCATPPPIEQASTVEAQAFQAFKSDHDAIVKALFDDLSLALETQVRLIEDYEIKLKGANVPQADLEKLLAQGRAKRDELAAKLVAYRTQIAGADKNFTIALQIHEAVDSYLRRPPFDASSFSGLLGQITPLLDLIKKK